MSDSAIYTLRDIVERESGIQIGDQKIELLKNRIRKRLKVLRIQDETQYLQIIQSDLGADELIHLLDVVSTNHTFFWRENAHFPIYQSLMGQIAGNGQKEIKTWCAASSSGEEPYTLAIINEQLDKQYSCESKILATDISTDILYRAHQGYYPTSSVKALPETYQSFFDGVPGSDFRTPRAEIKKHVVFKQLNLAKFPFPLKGPIDIIFCRNVMIYFTADLKQQIIDEFYRLLRPGGYLFISHSENLLGIKHTMQSKAVGVYQKPGGVK